MVLSAILYLFGVTALLALAAWALERAAHALGGASRGVWALATMGVLAAGVTVALPEHALRNPTARGLDAAVAPSEAPARPGVGGPAPAAARPALTVPASVDAWLGRAWLLMCAVFFAGVGRAAWRLRRHSRQWRPATILGHEVWLTPNAGPAVVGIVRPRVVLPRWALDLPADAAAFVLRHEDEHRRARDPLLLAGALGVLGAMPWNLPLWWIVVRLRIAAELDCDRRVLASDRRVRPYASLLIDLSARAAPPRGVLALASPPRLLERRIRAMTERTRSAPARGALFAALAALVATAACYVEQIEIHTGGPDEAATVEATAAPYALEVAYDGRVVRGTVTERATGAPVPGLEVVLPDARRGALTNPSGRFLLIDLEPGAHALQARHPESGTVELGRLLLPTLGQRGIADDEWAPARVAPPRPLMAPDIALQPVEPLRGRLEPDPGEHPRRAAPSTRGAEAVTHGTIIGEISTLQPDGEPIAGAQVFLDKVQIGALTNIVGRFLLLNVPIGTHTLKVRRDGFEDTDMTVRLFEREGQASARVTVGLMRVAAR